MSLTIQTTEDEQRQLRVTVEVAEQRVETQMRNTARQLARGMQVPGFRKGKVPYHVLVQRIGPAALRAEAVEGMVDVVYTEMLAELEETPAGQPTLDDLQMEPLVLTFTIPLSPVVDLGSYRDVRFEPETVDVQDEAVQEALQQIREQHAVVEPVSRGVMEGDVVTVSGTGEVVEGDSVDVIFDEERLELMADPEQTFPGTDFVANLIGMEVGDAGDFTISFPQEAPYLPEDEDEADSALAGKQAQFSLTVLDVKSRYLPELDDDLAQQEGDYDTLEELTTAVRERLEKEAEDTASMELFEQFMDGVGEGATLVYPPALVDEQLDDMLENMREQVKRSGWRWEDYLRLQGEDEESLRAEWQERAQKQVERGLLLRELIQREYLTISPEEVMAKVDEHAAALEDPAVQQQLREYLQQGEGQSMFISQMLLEKVYDRARAIVTGVAPDLEALAEAASLEEEE